MEKQIAAGFPMYLMPGYITWRHLISLWSNRWLHHRLSFFQYIMGRHYLYYNHAMFHEPTANHRHNHSQSTYCLVIKDKTTVIRIYYFFGVWTECDIWRNCRGRIKTSRIINGRVIDCAIRRFHIISDFLPVISIPVVQSNFIIGSGFRCIENHQSDWFCPGDRIIFTDQGNSGNQNAFWTGTGEFLRIILCRTIFNASLF